MGGLLRKRKGVMELSKIFRISGNYTQYGSWMKPDPIFSGEIVADETGRFCGYCDEAYGQYLTDANAPKTLSKTDFLIGAIAEESEGYSLSFFKLSNNEWLDPLFYEIHGLSESNGYWAAKGSIGGFVSQGNARVLLEELPYSEEEADRIKKQFYAVDTNVNGNGRLIQEVESWQKKVMILWV